MIFFNCGVFSTHYNYIFTTPKMAARVVETCRRSTCNKLHPQYQSAIFGLCNKLYASNYFKEYGTHQIDSSLGTHPASISIGNEGSSFRMYNGWCCEVYMTRLRMNGDTRTLLLAYGNYRYCLYVQGTFQMRTT